MRGLTTLLLSILVSYSAFAQVLPADTVPAIIHENTTNGITNFKAELRPLRGIAGAPAPFYTYFWEFGDGGFSFEEQPQHIFTRYDSVAVRLFATNNYDDGKRPPTRPKPIRLTTPKPGAAKPMLANNSNNNLFKLDGNIEMKTNCMPKPGDDMMLVMGYRNKRENGLENLNGTVAIFYNDTEFSNNNFELAAARTYHNEQQSDIKTLLQSAYTLKKNTAPIYYASTNSEIIEPRLEKILLQDQTKSFKNHRSWKFKNLKQLEERFVFLHFKTTPEMLKDTNAVVKISGAIIPDNSLVETEFFTLELQIVASHDPNKMVLRKSRMNYRLTGKNRELTYKVLFQNTGKGPAKKIDVGVNIAKVFDPSSIKIIKSKPEVVHCDSAYANQSCLKTYFSADSVHFLFSNIYLPGTQQKGVKDLDSTQGFVEYKIKFKETPPKLPIKSGAAIVFDKNEPIYTNRAVGRFKMGLSPGIILGYGFPFEANDNNYLNHQNFVFGASLSPYASHKYYWQAELYLNNFKETTYLVPLPLVQKRDTVINNQPYFINNKQLYKTTKVTTINAVPVQMRYSFSKYVAAGAGAMVSLDINHKTSSELRYELQSSIAGTVVTTFLHRDMGAVKQEFKNLRTSVFAEVALGLVRVGPSIGFRYVFDPKTNNSRMASYITWKF